MKQYLITGIGHTLWKIQYNTLELIKYKCGKYCIHKGRPSKNLMTDINITVRSHVLEVTGTLQYYIHHKKLSITVLIAGKHPNNSNV